MTAETPLIRYHMMDNNVTAKLGPWCRSESVDELEQYARHLERIIADAPHEQGCKARKYTDDSGWPYIDEKACDCFKSRAARKE